MNDFIPCRVCGEYFDPLDLDAVIFHEVHRPMPDAQYSGAQKLAPFFVREERQAALIGELAQWKGTRFWPGCGAKAKAGVGADCVSFVEGVLVNLGAIQKIAWPTYVALGGGAATLELILRTIEAIPNVRQVWKPGGILTELLPGDFFLRSHGEDHHHLAIYAGDKTLWNIRARRGVCTANLLDRFAQRELKAIYRVYEQINS